MYETTRQRLARLYPLHFQTIVERIYESWTESTADALLASKAFTPTLTSVFYWDQTPEGSEYWIRLAKGVERIL